MAKFSLRSFGFVAVVGLLAGGLLFGWLLANNHTPAKAQTTTSGSSRLTGSTTTPADSEQPDQNGSAEAGDTNSEQSGADADNSAALQAQAKITVEAAKQAAVAKVAGTVVSATLEDENGKPVYTVVIIPTAGGPNQDVKVDAVNGAVSVDAGDNATGGNEVSGSETAD